jgi:F-type H+-transporting ATPase subunit b
MEREALSGIFWERPTFWVAVAFVLFFVLFGKRLFAALTAMLDARAAAIRHELEEAARLRREAEDMLREATRKRETALAEANALLEKAEIEAARLAQAIREEAEANAKRREEMAHMRIAAAEKAALAELRRATTDVARGDRPRSHRRGRQRARGSGHCRIAERAPRRLTAPHPAASARARGARFYSCHGSPPARRRHPRPTPPSACRRCSTAAAPSQIGSARCAAPMAASVKP